MRSWLVGLCWVGWCCVGCGARVADEDDGAGTEADACVEMPPVCDRIPGDCSDEPPAPDCIDGDWVCPRAGLTTPSAACSETTEDPPPSCPDPDDPPECYDQGPGECSDAGQLATCEDGTWQCQPGWDFGDFGPDCEWPDDESDATATTGTSDTSGTSGCGDGDIPGTATVTITATDTGGDDEPDCATGGEDTGVMTVGTSA